MKSIPEEFVPSLCRVLKQQKMSFGVILAMSEEEMIQFLAQVEGNEHIRKLMESKELSELAADVEVQQAIYGMREVLNNDIKVIDDTLKILDTETPDSN